jgi:hypothetical protein
LSDPARRQRGAIRKAPEPSNVPHHSMPDICAARRSRSRCSAGHRPLALVEGGASGLEPSGAERTLPVAVYELTFGPMGLVVDM